MASRTIITERYTKILELFKISCIEERGESLSSLCRVHNISYKGLLYWMQNQGMTVKSIKKDISITSQVESLHRDNNDSFIPITVSKEPVNAEYLSDVNLTFSDGTMITVSSISADTIIELIDKYRKISKPC